MLKFFRAFAVLVFAVGLLADTPVLLRTEPFTSVRTGTPLTVIGSRALYYRLTWHPIGQPASCTVRVDSGDGTGAWSAGGAVAAQTCTTPGSITIPTAATYNYVRVSVTALTASKSVTVTIAAYEVYPAAGSTVEYPVMAYGAMCDGSTDDTTAIQAAITAAAGKGTVVFPSGRTCNASQVILSGIRGLIIEGGARTDGNTSTASVLRITGAGGGACSAGTNGGILMLSDSGTNTHTGSILFRDLMITYSNNSLDCLFNLSSPNTSGSHPTFIYWDNVTLNGDLFGATTKAFFTSNTEWLSFRRGTVASDRFYNIVKNVESQGGSGTAFNVVSFEDSVFGSVGPFGTVDTNGTAVTWVSGTLFNTGWASTAVNIAGTSYTISSCASTTACTLTGSAGVQAGVSYWFPNLFQFDLQQAQNFRLVSNDIEIINNGSAIRCTNGEANPADYCYGINVDGNWIGDMQAALRGTTVVSLDAASAVVQNNDIYLPSAASGVGVHGIAVGGGTNTIRNNNIIYVSGRGISNAGPTTTGCNGCRIESNTLFGVNAGASVGLSALNGFDMHINGNNLTGSYLNNVTTNSGITGFYSGVAADSTSGPRTGTFAGLVTLTYPSSEAELHSEILTLGRLPGTALYKIQRDNVNGPLLFTGEQTTFSGYKFSTSVGLALTINNDTSATFANRVTAASYGTATNCADSAGDAACGSAAAGAFVIDAADTDTVVSTTAVTANSEIFIQEDSSLNTRLSVTCNTTIARTYAITARTAATSFTVTASAAPVTNPSCLTYHIKN